VDWLQAVVYGIVQGATEYLPVSSSAHLALVPWIMGWPKPSLAFDILVQLGTLLAVIVVLRDYLMKLTRAFLRGLLERKPFADPHAREAWLIIVATIPAVVIGLAIKDFVEEAFGDPQEVLIELFATGALLFIGEAIVRSRRRSGRAGSTEITLAKSIFIGFAQALAILPGISRSGSTIAGALAVGIERQRAGEFSFAMSIPVMLGAGVIGVSDLLNRPDTIKSELGGIAVAFVVSAVVGFVVIRWFLGYLRTHSMVPFAAYCCVIATVGLLVLAR